MLRYGQGVRLDASVFDGQPEGTLRWHKYFNDTRDNHVPYSVNPFKFGHFGVRLTGRGTDNVRVTDEGGFVYLYRGGEALTTIEVLNWLAKLVNRYAMKQQNEAGQRALDRTTAMSKEQLNALPVLQAALKNSSRSPAFTPLLRVCSIHPSSRHTVDLLTETPVSTFR